MTGSFLQNINISLNSTISAKKNTKMWWGKIMYNELDKKLHEF